MELYYYGGNCLKIVTKKTNVIIDGGVGPDGVKDPTKDGDILVLTTDGLSTAESKPKMIITDPGEYEISGVSITGVPARKFNGDADTEEAIIYKIVAEDIRLVVAGHTYHKLNDEQLEALGTVDILCLPVGNGENTLGGSQALELIKAIEPKVVIPTYFKESGIKYPDGTVDLDTAIKSLSMEIADKLPKLKVKTAELPETTKLVVLERA